MTPKEFAREFYISKKELLDIYFTSNNPTYVGNLITSLNLNDNDLEKVRQIIDNVLTDSLYSILLGLDGESTIGYRQEVYKVEDESGNILTGGGLENYAWEYFHNNRFEIENSKCDFIARLTYHTKEQSGRNTPAQSGYKPQIKFESIEMMTSGKQSFINRKLVYPGDSIDAEIKLLTPKFYINSLNEGSKFEFREGSIVIGTGVIKHIINPILKKVKY